jgi:transposase
MLSLPLPVRVFLCCQPTDMRKSFDGLSSLTELVLKQDALSGHVFIFINRRRDRVKLLYWTGDGFAIWYKRLEKGTFQLPRPVSEETCSLEITASDLSLILDGIDLPSVKRRPRYRRPA